MTDETDAQPVSKKDVAVTSAKVVALGTLVPGVFAALPEKVSISIAAVMITCAAITASVPAPQKNRVLIYLYQIVRVIGLGVSYAVPYVATHLTKGVAQNTTKT